jgi:hypothetical protein
MSSTIELDVSEVISPEQMNVLKALTRDGCSLQIWFAKGMWQAKLMHPVCDEIIEGSYAHRSLNAAVDELCKRLDR